MDNCKVGSLLSKEEFEKLIISRRNRLVELSRKFHSFNEFSKYDDVNIEIMELTLRIESLLKEYRELYGKEAGSED